MEFKLNKAEEAAWQQFYNEHKYCANSMGAIGGQFTFIFTPTGVGTCVEVKCNACQKIKDITDIDNW